MLSDSLARKMTNAGFTWGDNEGDSINIMHGWNIIMRENKPIKKSISSAVLIIFLQAMLLSCGDSEPTDREVEVFYNAHRDELNQLVQFCVNNASLKRLWANRSDVDWDKKEVADGHDGGDINKVRAMLNEIGIEFLDCNRSWGLPDRPLNSVIIPVYSVGLSVSGKIKNIKYLPKKLSSDNDLIKSGEFKPLNNDGWYIYKSLN